VLECFSRLRANVRPHSIAHTRQLFRHQFGVDLDAVFDEFHEYPVGVGAIAQVYKAKLKQPFINHDGIQSHTVAVKVLHPHVKSQINIDLILMHAIARTIELIVPESHWLSLVDELNTFSGMMQQQVDFRNEARNLELFHGNFKTWSLVGFPQPIFEYSSEKVLVESWVDGIPLDKFLEMPSSVDRQIANLGLSSFLKMMVLDNHLHADLHPGNIIIGFQKIPDSIWEPNQFLSEVELEKLSRIEDEMEWKSAIKLLNCDYAPYLYCIDAGLCSSLSPTHLVNFIDLFTAITQFDGSLISRLMVDRSAHPESVTDFESFSKTLTQFIDQVKQSTLALKKFKASDIIMFMMNTVRKYHVKIDGEFANIAVAILLVEGIGKRLDPNMDLLRASVPFLSEAVRTRFTGTVSQAEKNLKTMLYNKIFSKASQPITNTSLHSNLNIQK
jgi:aarF domain-containing kinase